jgi:Fic family protein
MGRRAYRVEVNYPTGKTRQFFLVKDVQFGGKHRKVKKYLSVEPLGEREKAAISSKYAAEMELRAAAKKAEMSLKSYESQLLPRETLLSVERVRWIYNSVLELSTTNEIEAYEEKFEITYIQGTTSIEGNTLTRTQAENLLLHGVTPEGKNLREINEVQNFKKVVAYRNAYKRRVTIDFIRNLHALVMDNIDTESAGQFRRRDDLGIRGCDLQVTPSELIESELIEILSDYYNGLDAGKHPFELAVMFHYRFEMIHPFTDGNGRVGREILNYMLTRTHYPRLLFLGTDRARYIRALKRGNDEQYLEMVKVFAELIIEQRLKILEERLQATASGVKRVGQTRLTDFVAPARGVPA